MIDETEEEAEEDNREDWKEPDYWS